jgi:hypothetical protein
MKKMKAPEGLVLANYKFTKIPLKKIFNIDSKNNLYLPLLKVLIFLAPTR